MKISHKIKTYLDRLAASPQKPQSYLFYGPAGAGKEDAALHFVGKVAGKERDEEFSRRVRENVHPDVIIISPEISEGKRGGVREKEITIGQIRDAQKRMKFFPYELREKFCIIKKAHRMNAEAGNALLKMLEEPTERTFFILIAQGMEAILPTIISRCAVLRFSKEDFPLRDTGNRDLLKMVLRGEVGSRFEQAEKISKNRNGALEILNDWEIAAHETLEKVALGNRHEEIGKALKLIENLRATIGLLEHSNANARIALESFMLGMR